MDQQDFALARKPWGQALSTAAQEASHGLLEPLNGCDYHLYIRRAGQDAEKLAEALFKLQANPDANEIIQFIIRRNIEVLRGLQEVCHDHFNVVRKRAIDVIQVDLEYSGKYNKAQVRKFVQEVCGASDEQQRWVNILGLEINVSEVALKRLSIAKEAAGLVQKKRAETISDEEEQALGDLYIEFQSWRAVLLRWVLQLNKLTGNGDFLRRHRNELWDIVDSELEG
ncbi:uncharacterized protein Z519_02056 [Cladophialophora bantiana CBS 173.52]|uniref:Uncharacterized protein n=1 Tax=Cladophialophora bantiana (strain ATCC 10958 / CBS 173.52 / CDC B-1940 / NIH 8579) TaxID=1442370 RepID=A0A0D2I0H1_CLAB1|nr:uncharacterized protein Z519_02056 [Cladophialophora bantiana CBS 173.52]KIW96665.1 hypothetical protein Z519_02056 [Cladophialophora bantiana CBS 173.52]